MLGLYLSIVALSGALWAPVYKTDIELIVCVTRNFTKRLLGFRDKSYYDTLNLLNADALELRRLECDLVTIFKINLLI